MGGSHSTLTNCSFDENEAVVGGGIYNNWSSPTVTNCVLWNDLPDEINNTNGSSPVVTYSDIQFFSGTYPGTGNINADPLFVKPTSYDFHLQQGSPCIDTGSNSALALSTTDFEGDQRILDGDNDGTATADMGVDEFVPPPLDSDNDGLPDELENAACTDDPNDADTDDDGISDGVED